MYILIFFYFRLILNQLFAQNFSFIQSFNFFLSWKSKSVRDPFDVCEIRPSSKSEKNFSLDSFDATFKLIKNDRASQW